jgi:hypothetical protein
MTFFSKTLFWKFVLVFQLSTLFDYSRAKNILLCQKKEK